MIQMHPIRVERDGRPFEFSVVARVYDIGAISYCFIYENQDRILLNWKRLLSSLPDRKDSLNSMSSISKTLGEIIRPHIRASPSTRTFTRTTRFMSPTGGMTL